MRRRPDDRSATPRRSWRRMVAPSALIATLLVTAACEGDPGASPSPASTEIADPGASTAATAPGEPTDGVTPEPGRTPTGSAVADEPTDARPSTRSDVVTGGSTVSLPSGDDPSTDSIRAVDFAGLTYPSSVCAEVIDHPPRGGYHLHDGEITVGEDEEGGPYRVELRSARSFGDINGDGHEDAALVLACSGGGTSVPVGWIYTLDDAGPRPLAGVHLDPDALPITGVLDTSLTGVRISDTEVVTDWDVYIDGDALCCPAKTAVVVWTWTDHGLTPGSPSLTRTAG